MENSGKSNHGEQMVRWKGGDRWTIYYRLKDLGVACNCALHQPLEIEITTALAAIQVWHVFKRETSSRDELINWVENCLTEKVG